jgi:diguanylate cyclase (GGDEF)-like protein
VDTRTKPSEADCSTVPASRAKDAPARVLIMNHHQDPVADAVRALEQQGLQVHETTCLADSQRALEKGRPTLVVLNPLVARTGSLEIEAVEKLQADDDPVPVILLLDDLEALEHAKQLQAVFRDFVVRPCAPRELLARVELALLTKRRFHALTSQARELQDQVSIDFKTGLLSERQLRAVLQREFKRAQRHHQHMSLLLIDVDNFKEVNDGTDYAFGDQVLQSVAEALRGNIREIDFAGRFGGDEFAVLLPNTTPANAVQTAIRIRRRISEAEVRNDRYLRRVTCSIGIDTYDGRTVLSPDELVRRANKALQEAKRRGKNQVWLSSEKVTDEGQPPSAFA